MDVNINFDFNLKNNEIQYWEADFNQNSNIGYDNRKEDFLIKKIKKNRSFPNYLFTYIDKNYLNPNSFNEMIEISNNLDWEVDHEFLNYIGVYFIENNLYKKYNLWLYLNLKYFRCHYLLKRELFLIKYFNKKVEFYKKFDNLNLITDQVKKEMNIQYLSINNGLNVHKEDNLKNIKIKNIIDKIYNKKHILAIKINNKLKLLKKNFKNKNSLNLENEFKVNLGRVKYFEKVFIIFNFSKLISQINKNIENYSNLSLLDNFNENDKLDCAVCLKNFFDQYNFIIFCDGCNKAVHKDCYGISIDVGKLKNWYCDLCNYIKNKNIENFAIKCFLCKNFGGMMKEVYYNSYKTKHWTHLNCIYWLKHSYLEELNKKNKINLNLQSHIFEDACYICKDSIGCKIKCISKNCKNKFHSECQSSILSNIRGINFEIEDIIFYNCFTHSKEIILKLNILNYNFLITKNLEFFNLVKDFSNELLDNIQCKEKVEDINHIKDNINVENLKITISNPNNISDNKIDKDFNNFKFTLKKIDNKIIIVKNNNQNIEKL